MPVGCFSIAALFAVFVGSIVLIVFSAMKSTDVYREALDRARQHPAVIDVPVGNGHVVVFSNNPIWRGEVDGKAVSFFGSRTASTSALCLLTS